MIGRDRAGGVHGFRELDAETARRRGPAAMGEPLLDVRELCVSFATRQGELHAVRDVSLQLRRGEVLALVGESGSGKSVSALTLMGLTRGPLTSVSGSARLDGEELLAMSAAQLRRLRGRRMAMIFQDPQSSLNPVHRVGDQIAEQIRAHEPLVARPAARARAVELMERVGIARAAERVRAYPHELSGGQRQRVMIAMALSLGAPLLLADEPTTALDVTVQAQILAELGRLREQEDLGIVLITHDFGIVAGLADRVAVMRDGRIVEQGATAQVLEDPADAYTRGLLDALAPWPRRRPHVDAGAGVLLAHPDAGASPRTGAERHGGPGAADPSQGGGSVPLLAVEDLCVRYRSRRLGAASKAALAGVSLSVATGETLAVVGESGCGKTTLLRAIAGLLAADSGSVRVDGAVGMVFQDPQSSLNPRRRVGATLQRAVRQSAGSSNDRRAAGRTRERARAEASELLLRVGLVAEHAGRYPHELSGGQRQRVAIARALAGRPALLLLDEPVSSLDAALRRGIFELLGELQSELGCAYVVVSHDFGAVEALADRIAVMQSGEIVELAAATEVLQRPRHPYTRELLAARPPVPSRVSVPAGVRGAAGTLGSGGARGADPVPSSVWADRENSRRTPPSSCGA